MLFHVIGIREAKNKKYNIDILLKGESKSFIRTFLQDHNIIVLNISEYKKSKDDFGQLFVKINYHGSQVELTSYLTDIETALFNFTMIGFDIIDINFTNDKKLENSQVSSLLSVNKKEVEDLKHKVKQAATQKRANEKKIYKDDKLEKTIKIAQETFGYIDLLLQKVGDHVSKDKLRDIRLMKDELTKLKMGRNDDKMSELLEKIYEKINDINNEYLEYMQKTITYPISGSVVTNIDIISEYQKLKKAKKVKEIGAKRDNDDNYYLSFESAGLYLKLLFKDLKNQIKHMAGFVYNLFSYLELAILFIIVTTSLILWTKKVSYILDENLYNYVFLLQTAVFGLVLYFIQRFKKQKIYINLLLIAISILISVILFWLLKVNFSF